MALSRDLLETLHRLTRPVKPHVMQILLNDLAAQEGTVFAPGAHYEVWSPHDSADAAATLTKMLRDDAVRGLDSAHRRGSLAG